MLERIIIEMPLPTPRSVICSPSHIRNIVPVTIEIAPVSTNDQSPMPGSITFCVLSALIAATDWNEAKSTVP